MSRVFSRPIGDACANCIASGGDAFTYEAKNIYEAKKYFSGLIDFPRIDAGMDVMGHLQQNTNDIEFSRQFRAAGIDAPALSSYAIRDCEPGLLFAFTPYTPAQIRLAMQTASNSI